MVIFEDAADLRQMDQVMSFESEEAPQSRSAIESEHVTFGASRDKSRSPASEGTQSSGLGQNRSSLVELHAFVPF
jgi:hypothetical protein